MKSREYQVAVREAGGNQRENITMVAARNILISSRCKGSLIMRYRIALLVVDLVEVICMNNR